MLTRFGDIDRTFAVMDQLRRRMDRLFDEYEPPRTRDALRNNLADEVDRAFGRARFPRLTLADAGSSLVLRAEVPGLTEKQIQLSIQKDVLTMSGERPSDAPEGYVVHRQERAPLKFGRTFTLPCKIDPEKSTATLKNGVLTVTLTKAVEEQPRQIFVKVG
ncbi:MAG: Hsp20/alpha crystallin family protein [Byssovorax sp.]